MASTPCPGHHAIGVTTVCIYPLSARLKFGNLKCWSIWAVLLFAYSYSIREVFVNLKTVRCHGNFCVLVGTCLTALVSVLPA